MLNAREKIRAAAEGGIKINCFYVDVTNNGYKAHIGMYKKQITGLKMAGWFLYDYMGKIYNYKVYFGNVKAYVMLGFEIANFVGL